MYSFDKAYITPKITKNAWSLGLFT